MRSTNFLLLKTMLRSTSSINIIRYSHDKKARGRAWGMLIGTAFIDVFVFAMGALIAFGFSFLGHAEEVPLLAAMLIALMSLVFTFMKTNEFLFGFREYDMIMAMPFSVKSVVANRFLFMYMKDLPWNMVITLSMLTGYAIAVKPAAWVYPVWIILSLFVAIMPMLIAAALGAATLRITSGFRHKKALQIILTFIVVIPCFFIQYIVQYFVRTDKMDVVVDKSAAFVNSSARYVPGVSWFADSVNKGSISSMLLLVGVSLLLFEGLFLIISRSYRMINSRIATSQIKHHKVSQKEYKVRTIVGSVAFKEWKRLTGSTAYAVNMGLGEVFVLLVSLVLPFVNAYKLTSGAFGENFDIRNFSAIVPLAVYFMLGMAPTTACSPSLEGKNYWIIKSLPVDMLSVYKGKMLFNILLTVPLGIFSVLAGCFSIRAHALDYLLNIVMIVCACFFSTVYGMLCGARFMRLDWENEIEVIKQGTAITLYLLPNMLFTSILMGLAIFISYFANGRIVVLAAIAIYLILTFVCYLGVKGVAKSRG